MAIKQAILKKKIGDTVYDILVKTQANLVQVDSTHTLDSVLTDITTKLTTMIGEGQSAQNIATMISTYVTDNVLDATDSSTLAYAVAQNTSAIEDINDASTGILATAENYTDTAISTLSQQLAGGLHFKGIVDYADLLPDGTTGHERAEGDMYQVRYRGTSTSAGTDPLNAEYAFDGTNWVELGSIIDLSSYSTTSQMNTAIQNAITTYDTNTVQPALAEKARFLVSATEPADLTTSDIWAQLINETAQSEEPGGGE